MRKSNLQWMVAVLAISMTTAAFCKNVGIYSADNGANLHSNEGLLSRSGNWYAEAGVAGQWNQLSSNMVVANGSDFPSPYNVDLYSASNPSQTGLIFGGGYRFSRLTKWLPAYSLGLGYKHVFAKNIKGNITQYSSPEFLNYSYSWHVDSDVIMANAKINLLQKGLFLPYVRGGLGAAFTHTGGYSEQAFLNVTPRISPAFANKRNSHVAYAIGSGLDFQFSHHIIASLGYEYQWLGPVISGKGAGTWSAESLRLSSYSANELVFSLSYLFGA